MRTVHLCKRNNRRDNRETKEAHRLQRVVGKRRGGEEVKGPGQEGRGKREVLQVNLLPNA